MAKKILTSNGKPLVKDGKVFLSDGGGGATITTKGGWQGMAVPNSGYVDKVYFNTNLSVEEVVSLFSQLTFTNDMYDVLYSTTSASTNNKNISIVTENNEYVIYDGSSYTFFFSTISYIPSYDIELGFVGWNPEIDFSNGYEVNNNVDSAFPNGTLIGTQNNLLSSLFSTTPFVMGESETIATLSGEYTSKKINITEDGTIDVLEMINNDKLIPTTINATSIINFIKGNISEYSNETLEKIRIGLFSNTMIKNVNLPKLTTIPKYAFYSCGQLQTINCPNITEIEGYAFYADYSLTDINFPYATKIGEYAFIMCSELINVDLPNVTAIGDSCFQSCSNLQTINSPLLTTIGTYAFTSCTSLTNINMPNLSSCKSSSFSECTNLESAIVSSATNISNYAFANCYVLKDVDFTSVKYIYGNAFEKCYELNNVKFPNLVSIQEYYPFKDCGNLTDLYFGKYVSLPGNAEGTISANVFTGLAGKITIHVPSSEVSRFTGNLYWKQLIDAKAVSIVGNYTD